MLWTSAKWNWGNILAIAAFVAIVLWLSLGLEGHL
jgi:hypothetical protein